MMSDLTFAGFYLHIISMSLHSLLNKDTTDSTTENFRVANRPEFFRTVLNSDAVSRVPNGSVRNRVMSRIFTEQKSNMNNDPYFRFFAFDLCF